MGIIARFVGSYAFGTQAKKKKTFFGQKGLEKKAGGL
jgi:hypothetical protein